MNNNSKHPKAHSFLKHITTYSPGKSAHSKPSTAKRHKSAQKLLLASNECYQPSPKAIAAVVNSANNINRYPKSYHNLKINIAKYLSDKQQLDSDNIILGNGSDELINTLSQAYLGPNNHLLYSEYGFLMYPIAAQRVGAKTFAVTEKNMEYDTQAIIANIKKNEKISALFLANPNNPTGGTLLSTKLNELLNSIHPEILIFIDTAYAEYVTNDDYERGINLIEKYPNLVISGTFSKIYGLAGLRIGWMASNKRIIANLEKLRPPFNLNLPGILAAEAALGDQQHVENTRKNNALLRAFVKKELENFQITIPESQGNFLLLDFGTPKRASTMLELLETRSIFLRSMDSYGMKNALRVTISSKEEMQIFLQEFRALAQTKNFKELTTQ